MNRVVAFIQRRLASAYRGFGLKLDETDVLIALSSAGNAPKRAKAVAAALMCSTGAMTSRLNRLEESGYLRREYGANDRRSVLLVITADGQKIAVRANEAMMQTLPGAIGRAFDE